MKLTQILNYPLKSGAGRVCSDAMVTPKGLDGDRRWMVVDEQGGFLTARTHPRMTLLYAESSAPGAIALRTNDADVTVAHAQAAPVSVTVWGDRCDALLANDEAHHDLSNFLGTPCRLVYMPDSSRRVINAPSGLDDAEVSFADGYPILLVSEASLAELNRRLVKPVSMARFRPNLVVDGVPAHGEDGWKRIRIGHVEFACCDPCERCVLTTVDPRTGSFDSSGEPLRTLATYRRHGKGVIFGMNIVPVNTGQIRRGQSVEIL
ncbi:MAG: MOSC N-terminal beta barrel domain-containing protein [Myxococcota bacterium]|nr:MOSC N-terminal beta barrel domain-containing protein [Myxococcota bacterium]